MNGLTSTRAYQQPSLTFLRSFTSSQTLPHRHGDSFLRHKHAKIPPYPYGPARWYKQSNLGLYGRTRIQFGNTVSAKTEIKNRRKWYPNIRRQRLWSDSLQRLLRVRVQARVLRTIDKVGGLDEYLLGNKAARIKDLGMGGWALRWRVMRTEKIKERFREERRRLGLPAEGWVEEPIVGEDGKFLDEEQLMEQEKDFDRDLDRDDKLAEKGVEGGVELGDLEDVKDVKPKLTA